MDSERTPNRYLRKAAAAGMLTFMGVCGGMVLTGAMHEEPRNEQQTQTDGVTVERPVTQEGSDVTVPFALTVAGLGVAFASILVERKHPPTTAGMPLIDGSHDSLPFDPDIDLRFTQLTVDLAARFSPDTGRFNA